MTPELCAASSENASGTHRFSTAIYDPGSGLTVVRIVYSDETGIGGGKYEAYTVVTAVIVNAGFVNGARSDATQWSRLQRSVCALASRAEPLGLLERGAFKGSMLLNQARGGKGPAIEILHDLATAIRDSRVGLAYGAVSNEGYRRRVARLELINSPHRERWSPFEIAFRSCLESVEQQLYRFMPAEHVIWVHDRPGTDKEEVVQDGLRDLNNFWNWDHPDTARLPEVPRILHPICYAPSAESRMIQVADVSCTLIAGALRNDPVAIRYFQLLMPAVVPPGYPPHFEDELKRSSDGGE